MIAHYPTGLLIAFASETCLGGGAGEAKKNAVSAPVSEGHIRNVCGNVQKKVILNSPVL